MGDFEQKQDKANPTFETFVNNLDGDVESKLKLIDSFHKIITESSDDFKEEEIVTCVLGAYVKQMDPESIFIGVRNKDENIDNPEDAGIMAMFGTNYGLYDIVVQILNGNDWMVEQYIHDSIILEDDDFSKEESEFDIYIDEHIKGEA